MNKDTFLKLWLIAFFAVGVFSCFAGTYTPLIKKDLGNAQGQTDCDENGKPVMYVNADGTKVEDEKLTRIHEAEHARRMLRYPGGCTAFVRRYQSSSEFRFREEAAAYCAEARHMMYSGDTTKALIYVVESVNRYKMPDWNAKRVLMEIPCTPLEIKMKLPP
jgi:hypothetical protein